jgi:protein-disulfide isomerase
MKFAMALVILFTTTILMAFASPGENLGAIPIPSHPLGFDQGNTSSSVLIEAFYDLQCPDSKASYPALLQLLEQHGSEVLLRMHLFPLPYHRSGFLSAQSARVVQTLNSNDQLFHWFNVYFAAQGNFTNLATGDQSNDWIIAQIAKLASTSLVRESGMDQDEYYTEFIKRMAYGSDYDANTRIAWKYACSRGVSGTPFFFVNGVYVTNDPSWTVEDWKKLVGSVVDVEQIN